MVELSPNPFVTAQSVTPILLVIGTRPEAIKMLPVVRALRECSEVDLKVVTTGQHRQMLDQVFAVFDERPDIDLDLMTPDQSLADITSRVLHEMSALIEKHRPGLVMVHGDTTSAMAAALAAFYAKVPVGHVEAGLRSHDIMRPWPEEYNRISIDAIAQLLWAPTKGAAQNLRNERPESVFGDRQIEITGNTGIDALLHVAGGLTGDELNSLPVKLDARRKLVLVTGHRRESFGSGFARICDALERIAARGDTQIIYPVHLNPQVKDVVEARLGAIEAVHLIPPVDYVQMVALMNRARIVLTDSGGIQEEAPALGKPVLVMRDVTERPEAVATGVASLVGTDTGRIVDAVGRLLSDKEHYASCARAVFPYGDGTAARRIAESVVGFVKDHAR
ncbi:non-hydrolyzing UDP-N-acetylglucosamine 2-epimerase [Aurantiacibacter poecillastricola]|uniref:non-hydrolyzing UDP-N-acetylglucosamine 2-epimerase n=1 Tax=Aurantiacibacter poecillastricola TaxID=3064385 RepID=UPI00273DAB32|nr:UDP-N-acetylglucosamine 2-epimerase (non-hydrolyzing) [Aurantiacibacter sp. 219JJ12-13]MDP5261856.1 UDP-N-acetylglucosamine 2-epimerase (non-hydrolyzing) [Aurantiacibacter sp. 219JJ12-13]